jgi:agmatinase
MNVSSLCPTKKCIEFATASDHIKEGHINIIGFPFDGTACFKKGARLGPNAIRENLQHIESYSPYLEYDLDDINNIVDLGNLIYLEDPIDYNNKTQIDKCWQNSIDTFNTLSSTINLKSPQTKLLCLGGEHSISINPISKYLEQHNDLVLIQLDAHADLRNGYLGFDYSHASIINNCLKLFSKNHRLIQYGIRSGTKDEFLLIKKNKYRELSLTSLVEKINLISDNTPIYLTIDLDFLDPSIFPGTGTPEVGGETFHGLMTILKSLKTKRLLGADLVELAPNIDPTGISTILATTVFRELLILLHISKH